MQWLAWSEETYNQLLSNINKNLIEEASSSKQEDERLQTFRTLLAVQTIALEKFGPRLNGYGRISQAAFFAGDRDQAVDFALQHYEYHPLCTSQKKERDHLRRVLRPPFSADLQKQLKELPPAMIRNLACLIRLKKPNLATIKRLTAAEEDLDALDLSYLLLVGLDRTDAPMPARRDCVIRVLRQMPQHSEARIFERETRPKNGKRPV